MVSGFSRSSVPSGCHLKPSLRLASVSQGVLHGGCTEVRRRSGNKPPKAQAWTFQGPGLDIPVGVKEQWHVLRPGLGQCKQLW